MIELATVSVKADRRLICVVNAGLRALCDQLGLDEKRRYRLQLGTEEVFLYCVDTIRKTGTGGAVTVRFAHDASGFQIIVEYMGKRGELDKYLQPGMLKNMKVKTFEALGLCLAANILDTLRNDYWAAAGLNRYFMTYNCPSCAEDESENGGDQPQQNDETPSGEVPSDEVPQA